MTFKKAVRAVPKLEGAYRDGLDALLNYHQPRIVCDQKKRLKGSVNLDEALEVQNNNSLGWDYGIGHYNGRSEEAIWVEVHPASADHIAHVIRKVEWLRAWLAANATGLLEMTRETHGYVWLAAGGVAFQRGSPQARQLALAGVRFPEKRLQL